MVRRLACRFVVLVTTGLFGPLLGACASSETAADRQFSKLNEAVSKMQADHDRFDQRLGALEIAAADERAQRPSTKPNADPPAPPRVVQLGGPTDEGEDPADPDQRPEIRLVGPPGAAARPARGKSARGRLEIAESDAPLRSDAARPSALDPEAKRAYEAALAQVQAKQYDRGLESLNAFLVRWPDHPYAENAMYWRGEAYFAQGLYLRAAEQFEAVVARFASGNKAPDALLKLGMCHDRLGASSRAREYWDRLKNEYPRSDAAKRIPAGSAPKGPKESR
ncbi:MAG: tol-pal system protein YbgF [Labilithrix sp.]|nr:tol-pal system protein YbgF [Labilithrix sp.]